MKPKILKTYFQTLNIQLTTNSSENYNLINSRIYNKNQVLIDLTGSFMENFTDASLIQQICSIILDTHLKAYNEGIRTGEYNLQKKFKNLLNISEFNPTHYFGPKGD